MKKPLTILAALLAPSVLCGAALAQGAAPITNADVVGAWSLVVTPAEDQGRRITFKSRDGSERLNFPLTVTVRTNGRLACILDGEPADCQLRNGGLVVVFAHDGMRMIYTLTNRVRGGFSGAAELRVRLLPIGGPIGAVRMSRR